MSVFVAFPDNWPPYHNACRDPCDMLDGPCVCRAWHRLYEWDFQKKTRKSPEEIVKAHQDYLARQGVS